MGLELTRGGLNPGKLQFTISPFEGIVPLRGVARFPIPRPGIAGLQFLFLRNLVTSRTKFAKVHTQPYINISRPGYVLSLY